MEISHLSSFGVPEMIVECWRRRVGEKLLPVQEEAVRDFGVLEGRSLLISAPTSSGKTFCGEMAAAATIFRRRKAVLLVPLKSIAEEKYLDFLQKYGPLGVRVAIATRDHHEFEQEIEQGAFDLAVIVYEKFNLLITKNLDLLRAIDLILVDEIQLLGDPSRGADLELALLKVLMSGYSPQIIAFSAVLDNPRELADWLGCRLLVNHYRPTELRRGVLCDGRYHYRAFNSGEKGEEQLSEFAAADQEQALQACIAQLVTAGEQVLVFLRSKRSCEQLAWDLADCHYWAAADRVAEKLSRHGMTVLAERLATTLRCGIAFHHAGLSHGQRQLLEEGFRAGEVRVLISTTTLALGVNLPAHSVIIDCYKYDRGPHSGQPLLAPLDWNEYEGMSGRAGRFGQSSPGKSIIISGNELEQRSLWKSYVEGSPGELQSQLLSRKSLEDLVLNLIASGCARQMEELERQLANSFYHRQRTGGELPPLPIIVQCLESAKLVFLIGGRFEISPLGRTIALKGIAVASGILLKQALADYRGCDQLSWLNTVLSLPEAEGSRLSLHRGEQVAVICQRRLRALLREANAVSPALQQLAADDYLLTEVESQALATAFLMQDWISPTPTIEIEEQYRLSVGVILQVVEQVSWLLEAGAAVAAAIGSSEKQVESIRQLGAATGCGYDLPETIIRELGLRPEERDLAWSLHDQGIAAAADVSDDNRPLLSRLLTAARAAELINRFRRRNKEINSKTEEDRRMPRLRLPTVERRNRVVISYANTDIDVSAKSFNYLFKLAVGRLLSPEGWLDKEQIEPGFNQAKNIYRVKQELKRFHTGLEGCIENNKSGRYRLNLSPEQIQVDFDSMESYADQELAELSRRVRSKQLLAVS